MTKRHYFPILIDLSKYKTLVVGAGKVAARKVSDLIEYNNYPTVLAPEFSEEIISFSDRKMIGLIKKEYARGDIENYNLIFCATGNLDADRQVYKECSESGNLVNVADIPQLCSFILPATTNRGNLTISVSTQGEAPFFSAHIRKRIEELFPGYYEDISILASYLRKTLFDKEVYHNPEKRNAIINEFLQMDLKRLIEESRAESAKIQIDELINRHL